MKDNLKNRFRDESPEDIDSLEGHEHRFETKLMFANKNNKKKNGKSFYYLVAAACIMGIILSITLFQTTKENNIAEEIIQEKKNEQFVLADISFEAAYQEKYFIQEIENISIIKSDDPSLKPIFEKLNQLEDQHKNIENQLVGNIYNENLVNALINNYKLRLEVLEKLQKILEFKNKSKDDSHEKSEYIKS